MRTRGLRRFWQARVITLLIFLTVVMAYSVALLIMKVSPTVTVTVLIAVCAAAIKLHGTVTGALGGTADATVRDDGDGIQPGQSTDPERE